ncbi:hypothetical protein H0H81_004756 [Sphagnurus paluster]|uniref:Uncharacterized protein n=1 Tax=Sphagnurus paluster TaxID=117069 RepID=A0A9P7K5S1_9AGAR|nr:hypothetical protein H0H81_004756 [Sphagnurus paluster]
MSNFKQQASRGTKRKADLVFTAEDLFCGVEVCAERRKTKSGFTERDVYTPILPQSGSTSATPVSASDPPPPKIAVETCAAYIPDLHEDALEGTVKKVTEVKEDLDKTDHGCLESLFCDETRQQGDLFFANAWSKHFGAAALELMENHPLNSELFTKLKHVFLKTSDNEDDGEHSLTACGDDNDDYDITEDTDHFEVATPPNSALPQPSPDIPSTDFLNNQYVRIVDINGVHHLPLVYCSCQGEN